MNIVRNIPLKGQIEEIMNFLDAKFKHTENNTLGLSFRKSLRLFNINISREIFYKQKSIYSVKCYLKLEKLS